VDLQRKLVQTADRQISYDYLILAAGSATHYFGHDRFQAHSLSLHDLDEAERLRDRVLAAFAQAAAEADPARRAALMTVIVVGGGPTGVELAGAFAELIRGPLARDYPALDMAAARVVLVEGGDAILATFPAGLRRSARRALERRGVELKLGAPVTGVEAGRVTLADGSALAGSTVVWAAGVRSAALADALGVALGRAGRVAVEPTLNLPGYPEVFVVGDMAYLQGYRGGAYPMVAQVAMQMGKWAAYNIRAQVAGRSPRPFRYFDFGQMAMVGRGAALFDSFGLRLAGIVGWLLWLGVHLFYLPGLGNRLVALASWLAALLSAEAPARPRRPGRAGLGGRAPAR
jgi:NADH dehydrogenase